MTRTENVRFLPLAITRVDDRFGCVGAVAETACWIRPEPTLMRDIEDAETPYRYFCWASARVRPSSEADARPEDRDLVETPRRGPELPAGHRRDFLVKHLDPDVENAFAGERSLGLVRASVRRFHVMRSTGGRCFIRVEFEDGAGVAYDWIVPDIAFGCLIWPHVVGYRLEEGRAELLHKVFEGVETFFTLGLTKPNNRFPGKFRGCHPLVVGVHTVPDYVPLLSERGFGPKESSQERR